MAKGRKGFKVNQKQKKNLIALASGVTGAASIGLATLPAWNPPATGVINTVHTHASDFVRFTGLGNGALILTGIVAIGVAVLLARK